MILFGGLAAIVTFILLLR